MRRAASTTCSSSLFGPAIVGAYNYAYNFADVPAVQIGEQIGDVLLPSFARMKTEDCKTALVRSTGLMALIVFPLAVGLGVTAPTVVGALLGKKWEDVWPMLAVLSALSVTRPIGWTISSYLQSRDQPRAIMWLEILKLAGVVAFILVLGTVGRGSGGDEVGALWACGGVGVAFLVHALASMWIVHRLDAVPFWPFVGRCVPPLVACIPMAGAIIGVRYGMRAAGVGMPVLELCVELSAGAIVYVLAALVVARPLARDFLGLLRGALGKRRR